MLLKYSPVLFALASSALSLSTPMQGNKWTLKNMHRDCNDNDTKCAWNFEIITGDRANSTTTCTLTVAQEKASRTNGAGECESYIMTSGYDHTGFTVLYISNIQNGRHIWAGYDDVALEGGKTVKPDRDWVVYQPDQTVQ